MATAAGPKNRLTHRWTRLAAVLAILAGGFLASRALDVPGRLGPFPDTVYEWDVVNRNSSPLFIYGFNYVSVGLGSAVALVDQGLTLLTWPGASVLGALAAWRGPAGA